MAIELACTNVLRRPWGVLDLMPWNRAPSDGFSTGEVWYERPGKPATAPSLLLKLLFTSQPLSIQVHPDDVHAQSMGLPNGKTEAWYVLSAAPGAKVALGLKQQVTPQQLRAAVDDGSIADLVVWRAVAANDVISVPAGTIHAIGAGLVIAEVQQRSDATFRLFDYGRQRELHVERALVVANTGRADGPDAIQSPHRSNGRFLSAIPTSCSNGSNLAPCQHMQPRGRTRDVAPGAQRRRGCRNLQRGQGRCHLRAFGTRRYPHR